MESENIRFMSYFQIIVLTLSIFAFTYLVSESSRDASSLEEKESWLSKLFNFILKENVPLVSAESVGCCLETVNGEYCQEVLESQCETGFSVESCEARDECQVGCCYDEAGTVFSKGSLYFLCDGLWESDSTCNIPEAQRGCCYYGSTTAYTTQGSCSLLTQETSVWQDDYDWDSSIPESLCILVPLLDSKGACVNGDSCVFTTYEECDEKYQGSFYEDLLCTAPELETNCEPTEYTTCYENKVFFQDSCSNVANLYDSSKLDDEDYWTNYYSVFDSCDDQDSSCGNCDGLETICEESSSTKASCESISCTFTHPITGETEEYQHGDQWCVYESQIGEGHDVPGSEHYIATCNYGEVQYSRLQTGRSEICTTLTASTSDGSYTFEKTQGLANSALGCLYINKEYTNTNQRIEACEAEPYCQVGMVWFNSDTETEKDIPEYITDLNEIEDRLAENAALREKKQTEEVTYCYPSYPSSSIAGCSMATMSFDVDLRYGWVDCDDHDCDIDFTTETLCYEEGCFHYEPEKTREARNQYLVQEEGTACRDGDCYAFNQEFLEMMNNYCTSLGDCGVSANVAGDIDSSRLSVTINEKDLSESYINLLKVLATPTVGQEIIYNATDLLTELEADEGSGLFGVDSDLANNAFLDKYIGGEDLISTLGTGGSILGIPTLLSLFGKNLAKAITPYAWALTVSYAAAVASYWIGQAFKVTPSIINSAVGWGAGTSLFISLTSIIAMQIAGTAGGATAFVAVTTGTFLGITILPWLAIALGAGLIVSTSIYLFNLDRTVQTVTFSCESWKPVAGSLNCEDCGADGLPCSEYKCQSFGTGCSLEHTLEGDKCVALEDSNDIPSVNNVQIYKLNDYIIENGIENALPVGNSIISFSPEGVVESYDFSEDEKLTVSDLTNPSPADYGFNVEDSIDAYDYLLIEVNTSSYSECKLDVDESHVDYDDFDISMNLQDSTYYVDKNHYYILQYPDISEGSGLGDAETMPLFVRCKGSNGLESPRYIIKFSLNPGEDNRVPYIVQETPASGSYASYDAEEKDLKIIISEPANCSWSDEDKGYVNMENVFDCNSNVCETVLPLDENSENNYYIRCKDANKNMNQESMEYIINKPTDQISIDSISPSFGEKVLIGTPSIRINLSVETSGGTEDHYCSYSYLSFSKQLFSETGKEGLHEVYFSPFSAGTHTVNVSCEDWNTGDIAEIQTTFEIIQDSSAPKVLQNYVMDNVFYLVTDEFAKCYYSTENAFFNLNENGTKMDGNLYEHKITSPDYNTIYYIQCVDDFGNSNLMGKFRII